MNRERKDIPLENFVITVDPPMNRLANLSVNIHQDGRINLNSKLLSEIQQKNVQLKFTEDYKALCIITNGELTSLFKLPKSGILKSPNVSESLTKKAFRFLRSMIVGIAKAIIVGREY
jgi:hypothetical protein